MAICPILGKLSTRSNLCLFLANYCTLYLVKYKCIFQELPVIGADLAASWSLLWFHECILSKSQVFTSIALVVTSQFFALKSDLQLALVLKQPNKSDMFISCYWHLQGEQLASLTSKKHYYTTSPGQPLQSFKVRLSSGQSMTWICPRSPGLHVQQQMPWNMTWFPDLWVSRSELLIVQLASWDRDLQRS